MDRCDPARCRVREEPEAGTEVASVGEELILAKDLMGNTRHHVDIIEEIRIVAGWQLRAIVPDAVH